MSKSALDYCSELLKMPQWVKWKYKATGDNNRITKIPYNPRTEATASVSNPNSWCESEVVVNDFRKTYDGNGFVLTQDDPYFFIDIDNCKTEDGSLLPLAEEIINQFPTYWEISVSGNGLHAYGKGKIPDIYRNGKGTGRRTKIEGVTIEIYDSGRFFTFSEIHLDDTYDISDCQEQLDKFMTKYFSKGKVGNVEVCDELGEIQKINVPLLMSQLGITDQTIEDWINFKQLTESTPSDKDAIVAVSLRRHNKDILDSELMAILRYRRKKENQNDNKANRIDYLRRTASYARREVPSGQDEFQAVEVDISDADSSNWPEPYDIFGDTQITGKASIAKEMLPDVIYDFAFDTAKRMGVTPEMIAVPCLVACAAAIHDSYKIQPKAYDTKWQESPRLWVAIIADPGCKKTPALNAALEPLKKVEAKWIIEDLKKQNAYEDAKKQFDKAQKKANTSKYVTEPKKPKLRRAIINDITVEAIADILADNTGGILSLHDELMGLIGSMDAYKAGKTGGKDRSAWLGLNNGGPLSIDRVAKGRSFFVPNWSASLIGGVQPDKLNSVASTLTDDGLLQRFLPIFGADIGIGEDREPDETAYYRYANIIEKLTEYEENEFFPVITLSKEAQVHRQEVEQIIEFMKSLPETTSAMRGHLSKWNGIFARMLIVYHFVECLSVSNKLSTQVAGEVAKKVKHIMLMLFLPNVVKFYNDLIGGDDNHSYAKWVAGYILSNKVTNITSAKIRRVYRTLRNENNASIFSIMQPLDIAGWVKPHDLANGKIPTKWIVNPAVHNIFAEQAKIEKQRRENEKRKIAQAVEKLKKLKE